MKEMYSLRTQRLSVTDGSDQAKQLDAEIQKYGTLIAKSREQVNSLSKERFASKPSGYRFFNLSMLACKLFSNGISNAAAASYYSQSKNIQLSIDDR